MIGPIRVQGGFKLAEVAGVPSDAKYAYRIACAQVLPSEGGVSGQGGLDKLEAYAKEAASHGADVVVFPEYFLTGATHDAWRAVREDQHPSNVTHPDDDTDHFLSVIGEMAKQNDIDIVAGTVVETGGYHIPHTRKEEATDQDDDNDDAEHDQKLFNTVYYVDRAGIIAGRYTKKRLWHPERTVLSPGHELRHTAPRTFPITTRQGVKLRAGIAVCWDLAFPETFREMFYLPAESSASSQQLVGPDIVFGPTCWYATDGGKKGIRWNPNGEAALLDAICTTRAIENECIVAMTNIAGPPFPSSADAIAALSDSDAIGVGRTCICAPFVGCAARVKDGAETLLLAAVDLRMLDDARQVYKCRHDMRKAWEDERDAQANGA